MRLLRIGVVIGLFTTAFACGSDDQSSNTATAPTTPAPTTTAVQPTVATTAPASTPTSTSASQPNLVDVKVYFLRDERLVIAHRQVPGPAILREAVIELLAGPTAAELAAGLTSTLPTDTTLLDVNLADGLATVDLSSDFGTGRGSLSMIARVAQVVFTITQFDNTDRVQFRMENEPIGSLGGEGLTLGEPQTRAMIDRTISGSVIIDIPANGTTVRSPFTVTGEGDVYEAQFPIEVWANGEQIGGIAPVTAGAWGTWSEFEVTITLDAPAGPIELVAYDPGGCGTDPECPTIIKTIVPLIFTG
jgi:germination protein M